MAMPGTHPPRILCIAGSDSGGGAGIQADIKTITRLGGHAMTAITAITAQNSLGVEAVELLAPDLVIAQIDAVARDIGVDAIKIGMIGSAETAAAVAARLTAFDAALPIVFDPVMIASSGAALADAVTIALFERLMARATLVTPNLPELAALVGDPLPDDAAIVAGARAVAERCGAAMLVKGGHAEGEIVTDRLIGADGPIAHWSAPRIPTCHSHGTGCTLASGIATGLGAGLGLERAIARARAFVRAALAVAPGYGAGHGPMGHATAAWPG